ncbi:proton-associated sugar transporter a [Plakobranchus ocellatus]|uniref:Proton-associated sugar transporter a n=1 Tax=Plakobranchus ocellatus TaxID=259542 RepID=A0AAV4BPV1_9GAST|nr:proton-associated sugar transporter a [Plakobranchus ocellatus]
MMILWELFINGASIGIEANVAIESIFMIANVQTLGLPMLYAPLPWTVSTCISILLIPILGVVIDRWAKSKESISKVLGFTIFILLIGALCVFFANGIYLIWYSNFYDKHNFRNNKNLYNTSSLYGRSGKDFYDSSTNLSSQTVRAHAEPVDNLISTLKEQSFDIPLILTPHFPNTTSLHNTEHHRLYIGSASASLPPIAANILPEISPLPNQGEDDSKESAEITDSISFYAFLAMVGYCLVDCGYDSCNCFLKTFILHCTPPRYHDTVIVKSVLMSALGGVLVSILGFVDLGVSLTEGTGYDSNSASVCLITGLTFFILFLGALATFITGFCWTPPCESNENGSFYSQEMDGLVASSESQDLNCYSGECATSLPYSPTMEMMSDVEDTKKCRGWSGLLNFLQRQRKPILVNISTFFQFCALTSFECFTVNFLGLGVFKGNPAADIGSEEYHSYLKGVVLGSQGTLIYYITFAVTSFFHEHSLDAVGWKLETVLLGLIYSLLCLISAITKNIYVFYAAAFCTGVIKTVSMSVPYILINKISASQLCRWVQKSVAMSVPYILIDKISASQNGGKSSGTALAIVAAMVPFGFLVCTVLMGLLLTSTGNPSVSMYFSAVTALLGCICVIPVHI